MELYRGTGKPCWVRSSGRAQLAGIHSAPSINIDNENLIIISLTYVGCGSIVVSGAPMASDRILIFDTTLRDGERSRL
jgi:hypothetical protein